MAGKARRQSTSHGAINAESVTMPLSPKMGLRAWSIAVWAGVMTWSVRSGS